jgi:small conductance mechanosensitive channel
MLKTLHKLIFVKNKNMEEISIKQIDKLFGFSYDEIFQWLIKMGSNLLIAVLIFVVGFWLAKMASKTVRKVLTKSNTDAGLISFLTSLTSIVLRILVVVTGITQVGIQMTSFVAILGAAGLAIGMAFSGTLSNFAGGVMILAFKPFKVGDFVEMQGETGFVKEILIFNTYLNTTDNKIIILPNGPVANGNIINYTKADKRRVDFSFGIAYGDNLITAKDLLNKFIEEDDRILKDPAPFVGLGKLNTSSVDITVRVWTNTEDYWDVHFAMNERVYTEFEAAGLTIPFPQLDVHLRNENAK